MKSIRPRRVPGNDRGKGMNDTRVSMADGEWRMVGGIVSDTPLVLPVGTHYEELWTMADSDTPRTIGYIFRESDAARIIADHNAVADLREALAGVEARIKDTNWHPQYVLGLAYAHQRFEAALRQPASPDTVCPHCGAITVEQLENGATGCSTCFKMWEPASPESTERER